MTRISYPSLEHVAMEKRPYPAELLDGCESGLVLFAAAFLGHNDAIHFAEAGVEDVTLVDVDVLRLEEMAGLYRSKRWEWIAEDAFEYASRARDAGVKWDAVSVDTFTGPALERSIGDLSQWTSLARRFVTVTATRDSGYRLPRHWRSRILWRSSAAYWLVLEPDRVVA